MIAREVGPQSIATPEGRGTGGSSAGALAALLAVIRRPGVFGNVLVESPSLYVDNARILQEAAETSAWPYRIYLGVGTNEEGAAICSQVR
jgi:predicted alpha/beta superfamily hydrolase